MTPQELPADGSYVALGTGLTAAIVEGSGDVEINFTGTGAGFSIPSGVPVSVPHLAEMGGALYARTPTSGWVKYETA